MTTIEAPSTEVWTTTPEGIPVLDVDATAALDTTRITIDGRVINKDGPLGSRMFEIDTVRRFDALRQSVAVRREWASYR